MDNPIQLQIISLPFSAPSIFAVGAEFKSAFCLMRGQEAVLSPSFGDMSNLENIYAFETAYKETASSWDFQPEAVVCDMHPQYMSSRWAQHFAEKQNIPVFKVQHHHAHIASVMAEHHINENVLGICFDGTGYGTDGAVWGGEILNTTYKDFQRLAHLNYVPLAGGDISVKKPYRMALAHLWASGLSWDEDLPAVQACPPIERAILLKQFERSLNTIPTSSMGRLFDAVASLIGIRQVVDYEAQAAIELEAIALESAKAYPLHYEENLINPQPLFQSIISDLKSGLDKPTIAGRFQHSIVQLILKMAMNYALPIVALSGGVFQNKYLCTMAEKTLKEHGFRVFLNQAIPPSDAGLALGQASIIANRLQ